MHRQSGVGPDEVLTYKIELYNPDGSVKKTLQPFDSVIEAKKKIRELGEPYGARIKLIED